MFVCFSGMFHGMVVYCPDLDGFTICLFISPDLDGHRAPQMRH